MDSCSLVSDIVDLTARNTDLHISSGCDCDDVCEGDGGCGFEDSCD